MPLAGAAGMLCAAPRHLPRSVHGVAVPPVRHHPRRRKRPALLAPVARAQPQAAALDVRHRVAHRRRRPPHPALRRRRLVGGGRDQRAPLRRAAQPPHRAARSRAARGALHPGAAAQEHRAGDRAGRRHVPRRGPRRDHGRAPERPPARGRRGVGRLHQRRPRVWPPTATSSPSASSPPAPRPATATSAPPRRSRSSRWARRFRTSSPSSSRSPTPRAPSSSSRAATTTGTPASS